MFGDISIPCHSVWSFAGDLKNLYSNPNWEQLNITQGGMVALIDASGSMKDKQNEVKLACSALKCMTKTMGQWNVPDPGGRTALLDSVETTVNFATPGVTRLMILSDGDDTASVMKRVIASLAEDGSPILGDLPPTHCNESKAEWLLKTKGMSGEAYAAMSYESITAVHAEYKTYYESFPQRRREAVATHLQNIGVEMFVIGIGREVKSFINACAGEGRTIRTALISNGADADAVTSVISTVVRRANRAGRKGAVETTTTDNATAASAQETAAVRTEARRTSTMSERKNNQRIHRDGPPYDAAREAAYVRYIIEKECAKHNLNADDVEKIIEWFRGVCHLVAAPVAGDLISGRLYPKDKHGRRNGSVFDVPDPDDDGVAVKPSMWVNTFSRLLELLSRDPEWIYERVEGLADNFRADAEQNIIGPLFQDVGVPMPASCLAITREHLPQMTDRILYYKFKSDTYAHYELSHRASKVAIKGFELVNELKVVWRGNSGKASYGGPILNNDGSPCTVLAAASSVDGSGDEGVDVTDQVKALKRKIFELEEENKRLKRDAAAPAE